MKIIDSNIDILDYNFTDKSVKPYFKYSFLQFFLLSVPVGFLFQIEAIHAEITVRNAWKNGHLICFYSAYYYKPFVEALFCIGIAITLFAFWRNNRTLPINGVDTFRLFVPWILLFCHILLGWWL
ncbi:MAG: hypothetical protein AAF741_00725 [Bacteroidota bacterium]